MKKLIFLMLLATNLWAAKPIQIVTKSLPNGQNGSAYSQQLIAKFGTKPYTWSKPSGTLPTGLSLSAAGLLSGTPTVNSTYNFVIRVSGGTTADRSFTVIISGSAPVTGVKIDTTSLPNGTVSLAYSANLSASGGTGPYTWSNPSCSAGTGCIPPNLALTAGTGALGGTPVTAATYTFTIRVSDSSSPVQIYDRTYAPTISAAPSSYLWSMDFETAGATGQIECPGYLYPVAGWNGGMGYDGYGGCSGTEVWGDYTEVVSGAAAHVGTFGGHLHYAIPAALPLSGVDRYFRQQFDSSNGYANGLEHFFVRWYFKTHNNAGGTALGPQRKILFVKDTAYGNYYGDIVVTSDASGGSNWLRISSEARGGACNAPGFSIGHGIAPPKNMEVSWNFDTWYAYELEVQLNTPGSADGIVRFWVNGTQQFSNTALDLRGACNYGWQRFQFGEQVNNSTTGQIAVDEERYFDDLVINNAYVGP